MYGVPAIAHILVNAEGGLDQVVQSLRGYDDEDAQAFVRKWDSVSKSDRERLTFEEIAVAAGVHTLELLAAATKALFLENQTISAIIATTSHPEIVRSTIKQAKEPGGHRDRQMLHDAMGFTPTREGATFITNRVQVANFRGLPGQSIEGEEEGENPEAHSVPDLPDFDDEIQQMDTIEKRLLEGRK